METRRSFIQKIFMALGVLLFGRDAFAGKTVKITMKENIKSTVYRAVNGHPSENLSKVVELMGGIERFIGPDDVVVIKPNVKCWARGSKPFMYTVMVPVVSTFL